MIKPLILLVVSICLAYCSQNGVLVFQITKKIKLDIPFVIMVLTLSLFCGLRTDYNDTTAYIEGYMLSGPPSGIINNFEILENPLFYLLQSFFKYYISDSANVMFFAIALFSIGSILRFIKKYTDSFVFSVILFFALGLYVSHMAAMKQCLAIAVLTYALDALINKKYILYYALVFLAMLFHAFAILFVILPFFTSMPWSLTTYFSIAVVIFVLFTFESTITNFLSVADEAGKQISSEHVFNNTGINLFRLAVFAIPPLISLIFIDNIKQMFDRPNSLLMNMSILSFLIMSMGLTNAANLFGRSAIYFEIGTIVVMPKLLKEVVDPQSHRVAVVIVNVGYIAFFAYSVLDFSSFKSMSILEFLKVIF